MTGLIDRINRMLIGRIRPPLLHGAGIVERDIEHVRRLVVVLHDEFVGNTAVLMAEMADGRVLRVDEHDPGWASMLGAMDRSGRATCSSQEWMLRLIAGPAGKPLTLIGDTP